MSLTIVTSFPEPSIPPLLLTIPTTEAELITLAKAIERFIIVHRAHEGLEKALGKFLPQFDEASGKLKIELPTCPALKRLYEYQKAERPFAHYQQWLRETVKTRATPKSATSNPMTSPASSAPLYTVECEPPTPPPGANPAEDPQSPSKAASPQPGPSSKSVKRKNETDPPPAGSKKPKIDKNVYTRTEPGNCFVPPLDHACDRCKATRRVDECVFPTETSTTCMACQRCKQTCIADKRRAALGKPAHAKDPATKQRRTRRRSGAAKHDTEPSTSTADRTDKVSKGTARRDPFVLVPRHSLNLRAYHSLSDMGPSQQEAVENLPLDPRIQEATRVQEMMDAEVEELGSRVAQLSVFAERLSSVPALAKHLQQIPAHVMDSADEALKSAIDDVKVLPPGDIPRHSLKSVIQRCFDLINVQLQRGLDLQNAIGDFSTAVAEGESAFFRASQGLDSL
ncbi:hypothetical protein FA13DRAFT_1805062 [Coprinellus micaceus]|uniref:Uncharacterized protein n=1 Tax=Coprinellus micaceus TaxID=71717 RepID=A0A4Y7S2Z0_COPMI|nr:hypothetical protein FA13DRAFT_1805062 [Coprinellus micaceus]